MIETIHIENLKGTNRTFALHPLTVITGPNGSGKTTVLDAIRLALLGRHPKLGKQNQAIMGLASGTAMSVDATGPGLKVARAWERSPKGAVKATTIPKDFAVSERTELVLDPSLYFSQSTAKRIEYACSIFEEHAGEDSERIEKLLAFMSETAIEGKDPKKVAEARQFLSEAFMEQMPKTEVFRIFLDSAAEIVKNQRLEAERGRKANKATADTVTDMRLIEEQLERLPSLEALGAQIAAHKRAMAEAQVIVNRWAIQQSNADGAEAAREQAEYQIGKLEQELQDLVPPFEPKDLDLTIDYREARLEHEREINEHTKKIGEMKGEINALTKAIGQLLIDLQELENHEHCPVCKTKRKGWQDTAKKLIEEDIKAKKARVDTLNGEISAESVLAGYATEKRNKAYQDQQTVENYARALERHEAEGKRISQAIALWKSKLETEAPELEFTEDEREQKERYLNSLERQIEEMQAERDKAIGLARDKVNASKAHEALEQAEIEKAICEAWLAKIQEEREGIVLRAFLPVMEQANRLMQGVYDWKLIYKNGEIGKATRTGFIGLDTFSGSEEALTFAAVVTALASKTDLRIAIIDEFDRIDATRKPKVLENLQAMIMDGMIEQAIVVGTECPAGFSPHNIAMG